MRKFHRFAKRVQSDPRPPPGIGEISAPDLSTTHCPSTRRDARKRAGKCEHLLRSHSRQRPDRRARQRQDDPAQGAAARPAAGRHDGARQRAGRGRDRSPPGRTRFGEHVAAGERLPVLRDARRPEDRAEGPALAPRPRRDPTLRARRGGDHGNRRPGPHRLHAARRAGAPASLSAGQRRHRRRRGERPGAARTLRGVGQAGGAGRPAGGEQARHRRARCPRGAASAARGGQPGCADHHRRSARSRSGRAPRRRRPRPAIEEPGGGALDALDRRRGGGGRRPPRTPHGDCRLLLHVRCGDRLDGVRSVDVDAAAPPWRPCAADQGAAERGGSPRSGAGERRPAPRSPARASGSMAGRGSALAAGGDFERPRSRGDRALPACIQRGSRIRSGRESASPSCSSCTGEGSTTRFGQRATMAPSIPLETSNLPEGRTPWT